MSIATDPWTTIGVSGRYFVHVGHRTTVGVLGRLQDLSGLE